MAVLKKITLTCPACAAKFHPHSKSASKKPQRFCSNRCAPRPVAPTDPVIRFWKKVDRRGDDECWDWIAGTTKFGYGAFGVTSRDTRAAHRYCWELFHPRLLDGECLLHSCDNPRCVNPAHLRIGTRTDNSRDKCERNRAPRGESLPTAKLTAEAVAAIRADSRSQSQIALAYGITQSAVSCVRTRKTWKHIA